MSDVQRTNAAQRQARYRRRREKGLRCIRFSIRDVEVDQLMQLGLLTLENKDDRKAIASALGRFLDRAMRSN
jgi:hypothetical protein